MWPDHQIIANCPPIWEKSEVTELWSSSVHQAAHTHSLWSWFSLQQRTKPPDLTTSPAVSWKLAEWRSGSVSALPCERPGFASRTRLREIIPANNCTMQGQNNWGNWGSPGVMKLWVAWEVLRWLMKFRELCSGGFHPKLVTSPYHGFLNVNTPPNSQNSKRH